MIVSEGPNNDVDRTCPNATRYIKYALASKERKILPVKGCRMNRSSCGIMPLSFIKRLAVEKDVEGFADLAFLDREY